MRAEPISVRVQVAITELSLRQYFNHAGVDELQAKAIQRGVADHIDIEIQDRLVSCENLRGVDPIAGVTPIEDIDTWNYHDMQAISETEVRDSRIDPFDILKPRQDADIVSPFAELQKRFNRGAKTSKNVVVAERRVINQWPVEFQRQDFPGVVCQTKFERHALGTIRAGSDHRLQAGLVRADDDIVFAHYEDVLVSLHGIHQGVNAATAIVAAEAFLGRALGEDVVTSTLRTVKMPGRMELLSRNPMIVVDGAHNPAGMRAFVAALDGAFHVSGARRCVVGMLQGRDVHDMVEPLVQLGFTEFHCCALNSVRAISARVVADAIRGLGGVAYEHPSVATALAHARELSNDDDLIVAVGSLYLVAEVRSEVLHVPSRHLA